MWSLLEEFHCRWPWVAPGFVVIVLVVALSSLCGCATATVHPDGTWQVRSFARTMAVCEYKDGSVVFLAYPLSSTLAGASVLLGAAVGGAAAGPAGAAAGAGVAAIVEAVMALWTRPDPVPQCAPPP